MAIGLGANQYGKSEIRVLKVIRDGERHRLRDLTVDVTLRGDFEAVHVAGDNAGLPATDTMRNVVYAHAAEHPLDSLPAFGATLVAHYARAERVEEAQVRIREHAWERLAGAQPNAFQRGAGGTRVHGVHVVAGHDTGAGARMRHHGGIEDLLVLRSSGSAFAGFARDRFTTLPETDDRILATVVAARWDYAPGVDAQALEPSWAAVRDDLLAAFGDHESPSVQFTLHRMGRAVLERHPDVERIALSLPNRHHLPFDVSRFGIEDGGAVFQPTTEPYGLIEATLERDRSSAGA
jgi:urate oxidase